MKVKAGRRASRGPYYVDVHYYIRAFGHDETERVGENLTREWAFFIARDLLTAGLTVDGKKLHVTGVEVYKNQLVGLPARNYRKALRAKRIRKARAKR